MQTVADILIYAAARTPNHSAIISGGHTVTYRDLLSQAMAVGTSLQARGIRRGDCILTLLQNHQGAAILHWAAQIYGFVICPINWRTSDVELEYFAADCNAKAIFYDDTSKIVAESFALTKDIFVADAWAITQGISHQTLDPLPEISEDDISVILYTSGTTGWGKGVPRSHRAERAAAIVQVAQNALHSGDVSLGVMPLYHTMGVRILLSSALLSGCFVCQPKFEAEQALDLIEKYRITSLYLVPTLFHDLVLELEKGPRDLSSVSRLGFAGASMLDGLLKKVSASFPGTRIVNHYGSSEIYTYTINQDAALKPGSAGRAGLNSKIAIIPLDCEDVSQRVLVGEQGQIIASIRSAEAFNGYLNRPADDAASLRGTWYFTSDIGYQDDEGDLFLTGRVDDMIVTGGENVMPIEIESILSLHPDVEEAAVVGTPDERLGQKITAFIVRSQTVTESDLDTHCRESGLPGYRCPKEYNFVQSIPKSPVGKIIRRLL